MCIYIYICVYICIRLHPKDRLMMKPDYKQITKHDMKWAWNRDCGTWGLKSDVERRPEDDGSSHLA